MVDLESATIQLYEDESLTGDLKDEEAQTLLKWGESRLATMVEQHADDEDAFDTAFSQLRRLIKSINRFIGSREYGDPEEQRELLAKVVEAALALDPDFNSGAVEQYAQAQAQQPDAEALQSLLAWVTPSTAIIPLEDDSHSPPPDDPPKPDIEDLPPLW